MTNYERIKNMSVEELAKVIFKNSDLAVSNICEEVTKDLDLPKYTCPYGRYTNKDCINCIKTWLESEVEG